MKKIYFLLFLGLGYLAYGWKGVFWSVIIGIVLISMLASFAKDSDEFAQMVADKVKKVNS